MRVIEIAAALRMDPGEIVPAIRGKVTKVGDYYDGTNENGDWSFQKIYIKSGKDEVILKLTNRPQESHKLKGAEITACSNNGKHGLQGLKIDEDTYKDKTTLLIKVTPSADFGPSDEGGTSGTEPSEKRAHEQPPGDDRPAPRQAKKADPAKQIIEVKKYACKVANAHRLAFDATLLMAEQVYLDRGLVWDETAVSAMIFAWSEEAARKLPTTIAISLDRAGMIDELPFTDLTPILNKLRQND